MQLLNVEDLNLPAEFVFVDESPQTVGPTCSICCDCCLCEIGGV